MLDSQQPQIGQNVSVYRCYVKQYTLNYECEFLASTSDCFSFSVLYNFKALDSFNTVMRFVDMLFERETHILYNQFSNSITSFHIEVYQDKEQRELAKQ